MKRQKNNIHPIHTHRREIYDIETANKRNVCAKLFNHSGNQKWKRKQSQTILVLKS